MDRENAAKNMIINDLEGIISALSVCPEEARPHFMLGGLIYFSIVISGAIDWCKKAQIVIPCTVDEDIVKKLRTKVKLYSGDNIMSFDEQKRLISEIVCIEKQYWIDRQANSGKYCPKFLIPNIGAFKIDGHYIGNSLGYAYEYSPLNPDKKPIIDEVLGEDEEKTKSFIFAKQMGQMTQVLYSALKGQTFDLVFDNDIDLRVKTADFRVERRKLFKKTEGFLIFNVLCRINYLIELFRILSKDNAFLAFRMIYITFYHLKDDLKNLKMESVYYNMPYRNTFFRNAMAHYSLYGKISDSEIIDNSIGFGLFEKYFNESFNIVNEKILVEFYKTRDSLERHVKV